LAIKGPQIVVEGDDITVECGASKYNYTQDIKWIYRDLNNIEKPVNNDKSEHTYFSTNIFKFYYFYCWTLVY